MPAFCRIWTRASRSATISAGPAPPGSVASCVLEAEGKRVEADLQAASGEALFVRTDVTSEDDWRHVMQTREDVWQP